MRVLLVEPYYAGSHQAWADGYAEHSEHDVRLITHAGRWWKWRMRGAAVTLARALSELEEWRPDVVLVSGMVDLAHFRLFAQPWIGDAPVALYLHETQLTYPQPAGTPRDDGYALTNWISAYSADRVFFNSGYHLDVFFESLPGLLRRFPDRRHDAMVEEVVVRSEVLPVGVDLSWIPERSRSPEVPRILWSHRWEYDKDPGAFADAIEELVEHGADFELVLLGPRHARAIPAALRRIREAAADRIVHDGAAPLSTYRKLVAESDVVVSTARQEFFGISVVEAVAAGCRPVLPARLSYPWLIPQEYHGEVLYERDLGPALVEAVADPVAPSGLAGAMAAFSWDTLGPTYDTRLTQLHEAG